MTTDNTMPDGKWEFDADVAGAFDDMLARSIPQYEVMRRAVTDLAVRYAQIGTVILDLGCSRGEALAQVEARLGNSLRYVGVEVSEPMLAAARQRFEGKPHVVIDHCDLRVRYPPVQASVTLCVLTLQFTPIEYRHSILRSIYRHTRPGGALILVEKILGATPDMNDCLVDVYYALKAQNGYSQDQIERKRLSLEGVLVPVTAAWNEQLLAAAGFSQVENVWRWMNFAGWVAVRDG